MRTSKLSLVSRSLKHGFLLTGLIAGLSFISLQGNASPNPGHTMKENAYSGHIRISVVPVNGDGANFNLTLANLAGPMTTINILDKDGNTLYSEVIKNQAGYHRLYNLSQLGDGMYTFQIRDNGKTYNQTFEVTTLTQTVINKVAATE